jgi:hypothetical protein
MIQHPGRALPGTTVFKTALLNDIPAMTDPLGRHWDMPPNMREVVMDDTHVWLTKAQVRALPEYSSSYPSGTYDGKCWMRDGGDQQWLCWYYPSPKPKTINIGSRIIVITN